MFLLGLMQLEFGELLGADVVQAVCRLGCLNRTEDLCTLDKKRVDSGVCACEIVCCFAFIVPV